MSDNLSSLDDLFNEAKREMAKAAAAAKVPTPPRRRATDVVPAADPSALYTNPTNWTRTRGIALIHAGNKTLLGNFDEWTHRTMAETRRLVRAAGPIKIDAVEEITCSERAPEVEFNRPTEICHTVRLDLELEFPTISSYDTELNVYLAQGGIMARVELVEPVTFVEGPTFLLLPAGTNILPALSRLSKLAIKALL